MIKRKLRNLANSYKTHDVLGKRDSASKMTDPGFISVEPSLSLSKTLSSCQENLSAQFLSIAIGLRVRSFPRLPRGHPRRSWLTIVQGSKESHRKRHVPGPVATQLSLDTTLFKNEDSEAEEYSQVAKKKGFIHNILHRTFVIK